MGPMYSQGSLKEEEEEGRRPKKQCQFEVMGETGPAMAGVEDRKGPDAKKCG